jgi:hypothetical protein
MRHYEAIEARAAELGLPKSFTTDLTEHDRAALEARDPAEPFGWIVYSHGTHLVHNKATMCEARGITPTAAAFELRGLCDAIDRNFSGLHCHFWNGRALVPVADTDALADRLAAETP